MPELPEVETVRRSLLAAVVGRRIVGLRPGGFDGVVGPEGVNAVAARLVGRRLGAVARRGKYLLFALDDGTALVVHLRMTGQLVLCPRADPPLRFEHLAIELDDGADLRFADQRKFGRVLHVLPEEADALAARIGPEPLEDAFTPDVLADRLRGRTAPLKASLLDQRRLAGLGNIYADEALFRARLHPERPAGSLTREENDRLHAAIRAVLAQAIANRGTTFADFRDGYGAQGSNQDTLQVYGRGRRGAPCPACGTPLTVLLVAGRSSHLCPTCQPMPTARSAPAP